MSKPRFHSPMEFVQAAAINTEQQKPVAQQEPAAAAATEPKPWEAANPRVKVVFSVRMDEPLHKKLAYVAEHLPGASMHSIMLEAANEKIDAILRELEKGQK